ncbi:MAG: FAD-dependent oxidoreductase [Planctomycetota bacterium]
MADLPAHARVVVIGGGIVGCSVAYHLAKLGWKDVVVLERAQLTSGSTFHAAGLVGQLRSSASITQLLKYSVELYGKLEQETGHATGWRANGGLRLACTQERWTEVRRQATTAHSFGLEMHLLSPKEAQDLWPLMQVDDLVGAALLPTDGQVSPSDLAVSMAKGARQQGAVVVEECPVQEVLLENGAVAGVRTAKGEIRCEVLVNCGGLWARELGLMSGVSVPVHAMQHQFMITEPIEGVTPDLPTLRDPDRLVYFKEEVGGLVMGGYELDPKPWALGGVPRDWTFKLIDPDWEHFESLAVPAFGRVPALENASVRQLINGPEAFTPDGTFVLGEAPEVRNYFVAAGFNAFGIAAAGGAGKALAEWIVAGGPQMDLWPVDIRRFGAHHRDADWARRRTMEAYAHHYTMSWPHEEHHSGRPHTKSPLYDRLQAAGACFGEKMGWERANWFAPAGTAPKDEYSYGYQNWFPHVGEEHRAAREAVALFDSTSFAKFVVRGADAAYAMSWICAGDVQRPAGQIVYTQLLNDRGGIECDLTVTPLEDGTFYVVTGTGYRTHDADWIRKGFRAGAAVALDDVTHDRAVIGLMGPRARDVLAQVTDADLDNAAFPFLRTRTVRIAGHDVLAMRVTFVGELGWELHVPTAGAAAVYDALRAAGAPHGLRHAGYRAIDSLRLEKGYRVWGRDITPDHTPLEAGLGFAVKLTGDTPFRGREALLRQRDAGRLPRMLVTFTVDDPAIVLLGRETIHRDGKRAGWLTSGGFGYTIGRPIGMGYVGAPGGVTGEEVLAGRYELEVAGDLVPAVPHLRPLYDPRMERVRG